MKFAIDLEQEGDGRWIAEIDELDGVLVYGDTKDEAIGNVKALALRVIADRWKMATRSDDLTMIELSCG